MNTDPQTDPQLALRDRIAEALIAWTYRGKDPEHGGILDTVRANAYSRADAVLAVLPPSADRADVCICGHTEQQHFEDVCITEVTGCQCGDYLPPDAAAEVIDRWRQAATKARADRAAVLREAADIAESLRQFERCTGPRRAAQTSENVGILRVADELRRVADEAQQQKPTTVDKAAALGMTDTEYRAHSHRAAVDAVRAAAQGLYAGVGVRVLAALDDTAPCGRLVSLPGPCSAGDHCCNGPVGVEAQPGKET